MTVRPNVLTIAMSWPVSASLPAVSQVTNVVAPSICGSAVAIAGRFASLAVSVVIPASSSTARSVSALFLSAALSSATRSRQFGPTRPHS